MVTTPWWVLAILAQITLVGVFFTVFYMRKARSAGAQLLATKEQLKKQQELSTGHKLKIAEMELQLESLDAFQEMYFDLQSQHEKLQAAHVEFTNQAKELLSDEDQEKLQSTLTQLQQEKEKLEQKLQHVDAALQEILSKQHFQPADLEAAGKAAQSAMSLVDNEIRAVGGVIEQQQQLIAQLSKQVTNLQVEIEAKQQLEQATEELRKQNQQLAAAQAELEKQNGQLRKEVKAMAVKERAVDTDASERILNLEKALASKEKAYHELHKKYVDIEAEYQKIYAKNNRIQA